MKQDPDSSLADDPDEALWIALLAGDRSADEAEIRERAEADPAFARRLATLQALGASFDRVSSSERELFAEAESPSGAAKPILRPLPPLEVDAPRRPNPIAWLGWAAAAALLAWTQPWKGAAADPATTTPVDPLAGFLLAGEGFPVTIEESPDGGVVATWDREPGVGLFRVSVFEFLPGGESDLLEEVEGLEESRIEWETPPWQESSELIEVYVELLAAGRATALDEGWVRFSPGSR